MKKGFQRVKVDGQFYEIADAPALDKKYKHDIDVVVDRIVVRPISARAWPTASNRAEARRRPGIRRICRQAAAAGGNRSRRFGQQVAERDA
jgi:excinuclease UvrABC ATPase subunit